MKTGRRLFALVAAFAVAFGALWPLVSAARPGPPAVPNLICTQGGFHPAPSSPADTEDNFHCPLCVVSMDSAAVPPVCGVAVPALAPAAAVASAPAPSFHGLLLARPPPARAPPLVS